MILMNEGKQNFIFIKGLNQKENDTHFQQVSEALEDPASSDQVGSEEFQGMFNLTACRTVPHL